MWIDVEAALDSHWVYLVVVALILCDVYVPVLPSGTSLIVATVYAYRGSTSEILLLLCAAVASTLGDYLAFRLAQRGSRPIRRLTSRLPRADHRLRAALRGHLGRTVVFARFVPTGRCLVTMTSGSDPHISVRQFQPWSAVAAICWAGYTVALGHLNALLFPTAWLGAAVAVLALLVIGALLARVRSPVA